MAFQLGHLDNLFIKDITYWSLLPLVNDLGLGTHVLSRDLSISIGIRMPSFQELRGVSAHEFGIDAAKWMLEQLENSNVERRRLLIEWIRLLLERPELIEPLGLLNILTRMCMDDDYQVAVQITRCLAKTIDYNKTGDIL